MIESFYIGVYWGIRKESLDECTRRISSFFERLAECDPLLAQWYELGQSRQDALARKFTSDEISIKRILGKNRTDNDLKHQITDELGFRISLWTGNNDEESANIRLHCGCYSHAIGINSCVLSLPAKGHAVLRILQIPTLIKIMDCMVSVWEADWGTVNSTAYLAIAPKKRPTSPMVGWVTYLASRLGEIPPLPSPIQVVRLGTQGSLIIVTDKQFTVNKQSDVDMVKNLDLLLDQANLLKPLK